MAAYLIRHAHAGSRKGWDQPDQLRPLSKRGHKDARLIAELLSIHEIGPVLSSPAVRCVQTVEPLAARVGVPVEETSVLFEGSDPNPALDLLVHRAADNPVLCSHGDVIPDLIRLLQLRGMGVEGAAGNRKGSVWILEHDGDRFVTGRYVEPSGALPAA